MNGIDDFVPGIAGLTSGLERDFACRVWCNAYLSFGAGSAFDAHYDRHDVLILQIHGRKRWRSYGVPVPHPIQEHSRRMKHDAVTWEGILEPGDVLYLPRGEVHAATLDGPHAVHLTIGMSAERGIDFAEWLLKAATEEVIFREDIPRSAGEAALSQYESTLKQALHARIERADLRNYLDGEDRARGLRPFINLGADAPYHPDTVIISAVRRHIPLDQDSEGESEVSIGGEIFRLSRNARRLLAYVIARGECRAADLAAGLIPPLTDAGLQDAVAELARNSLIGIRI
jgi:hypothetical protein